MLDDPACLFTGVRVAIGCHIHLKFLALTYISRLAVKGEGVLAAD